MQPNSVMGTLGIVPLSILPQIHLGIGMRHHLHCIWEAWLYNED